MSDAEAFLQAALEADAGQGDGDDFLQAILQADAGPSARERLKSATGDERASVINDIRARAKAVPVGQRVGAKTKATKEGARGFLEHYYPGRVEEIGEGNYAIFDDQGEPVATLEGRGLFEQLTTSGPTDILGAIKEAGLDIVDIAPEAAESAISTAGAILGATGGAVGGTVAAPGPGTVVGGIAGGAGGAMAGRAFRQGVSALLPGDDFPEGGRVGDVLVSGATDGTFGAAGKVVGPVARPVVKKAAKTLGQAFAKAPRAALEGGKAMAIGAVADALVPGSGLSATLGTAAFKGLQKAAKNFGSEKVEKMTTNQLSLALREAGDGKLADKIADALSKRYTPEEIATRTVGRLIGEIQEQEATREQQDITRRGGIRR